MSEENKKYYKYVEGVSKPWRCLTKKQKHFIGKKVETKNGNCYTVCGVSERLLSKNVNFIYECDVCSKDSDLWGFGSIQGTKNGLLKEGKSSCSCGRSTRWTEQQYLILINRRCEDEGYLFKGWLNGFGNADNTRLILYNKLTGNEWSSCNLTNFINSGSKDPSLLGKKEQDQHIQDFLLTGKFEQGTTFWKSKRTTLKGVPLYFNYNCPLCSKDIYVKEGLCSGVFEGHISNLKAGMRNCRCSDKYKYTQPQIEFKIKQVCSQEGCDFLGWADSDYKNRQSKLDWLCKEGHKCKTEVYSFLSGTRCPTCATSGFRTNQPASFYIVRWYGYGENYLKYGITNQDVLKRIKQQARKSHLDYKVLHTFYYETGQTALDIENKVKDIYGREGVCPKKWFPDGFTETIHHTPENLATILELVDQLT